MTILKNKNNWKNVKKIMEKWKLVKIHDPIYNIYTFIWLVHGGYKRRGLFIMSEYYKSKLIKIPEELDVKLKTACQAERRNMSNMIEYILYKYFEKKEG